MVRPGPKEGLRWAASSQNRAPAGYGAARSQAEPPVAISAPPKRRLNATSEPRHGRAIRSHARPGSLAPPPQGPPAPRSPFRPLTSVLQGRTSSGPGDSTLNCTDLPVFPGSVSPAGTHAPRGADSYLFLHPSISSKPRRLSTRPCSKRMRSPCPKTERLRTGMARTSPRYRKGNPSYRGRGRALREHAAQDAGRRAPPAGVGVSRTAPLLPGTQARAPSARLALRSLTPGSPRTLPGLPAHEASAWRSERVTQDCATAHAERRGCDRRRAGGKEAEHEAEAGSPGMGGGRGGASRRGPGERRRGPCHAAALCPFLVRSVAVGRPVSVLGVAS